MTDADIIVNLATMIAEQRLEISELKTEVDRSHHELIATMSEAEIETDMLYDGAEYKLTDEVAFAPTERSE